MSRFGEAVLILIEETIERWLGRSMLLQPDWCRSALWHDEPFSSSIDGKPGL